MVRGEAHAMPPTLEQQRAEQFRRQCEALQLLAAELRQTVKEMGHRCQELRGESLRLRRESAARRGALRRDNPSAPAAHDNKQQ
jgi:hypothetical protein